MVALRNRPQTSRRGATGGKERLVRRLWFSLALFVLGTSVTDIGHAQQHRTVDPASTKAVRGGSGAVGGPASGSGVERSSNRFPLVPAGALYRPMVSSLGRHQSFPVSKASAGTSGVEVTGVPAPGAEGAARDNGNRAPRRPPTPVAAGPSNPAAPRAVASIGANTRASAGKATPAPSGRLGDGPKKASPPASDPHPRTQTMADAAKAGGQNRSATQTLPGGAVSAQPSAGKTSGPGTDGTMAR